MRVGTSGFSFDDWRGAVYPERLPRAQWLPYYEQHLGFNALELNYTYYQMPVPRTLEGLVRKTTHHFRFAVKTHRSMTHDILQHHRPLTDHPSAFEAFREGITPLAQSGRLSCVLAQFPYAFRNTPEARAYLERVMDRFREIPLVVEFRHRSWVSPDTLERLRARQVGVCSVDEPQHANLMPWVGEVTSALRYVRFHGRNAHAWFGTSTAERYDYLYSDAELRELRTRLMPHPPSVQQALVFFNNCHAGAAAKNALRFKELLREDGLAPQERAERATRAPASLFS